MNIEVLDGRQVAHAARDHYIYPVLDTTCVRAVADPHVRPALVRIEWNEYYIGPFTHCNAGKFRKFNVIAYQDRDLPFVGVEDLHFAARFDAPPSAFARRDVDLVLFADRTVASEKKRDVV
jgi:hypothetical protein